VGRDDDAGFPRPRDPRECVARLGPGRARLEAKGVEHHEHARNAGMFEEEAAEAFNGRSWRSMKLVRDPTIRTRPVLGSRYNRP
jgi:hypothetical protein